MLRAAGVGFFIKTLSSQIALTSCMPLVSHADSKMHRSRCLRNCQRGRRCENSSGQLCVSNLADILGNGIVVFLWTIFQAIIAVVNCLAKKSIYKLYDF